MEEINDVLAPIVELCDEDEVSLSDVSKADTEMPSLDRADLARDFLVSDLARTSIAFTTCQTSGRIVDRHAMGHCR